MVISLWAYKWFNLKQTLVAIHVMTGSTGHLNLLGWCDYNILLQVLSGWFCVPMVVVSGRVVVLPWRWWLELMVVVLAFRRVAALPLPSLLTTPRPPFKGALVAMLRVEV